MSFEKFDLKPYSHQRECEKLLSDGCSFVLRAPTGSGKSEAVFIPFLLHRDALPLHMIYSLPMRTLVEDIAERFNKDKFRNFCPNLRVVGHHGKHLEAPLFYADVIVTTIDQAVGAYACTPLSLPVRYGNIPAGAVSSAFLVFDEVHTFEPLLGLQAALILAEHSCKLGFPVAFLSATLPDVFVRELEHRFNVQVVESKEEDIPARRDREVILHYSDGNITPEALLEKCESSEGRVIAVCNTVERAQELYEKVKGKVDCEVILLHSRFLDEDRRNKEEKLKEIFDPKGMRDRGGILISTQVIEVGLDISCEVMLSELAPIDSLIQRAGRCARRGGRGDFYVFDVANLYPYEKERDLVNRTREKLKKINGEKLTWELERKLVNDVLSEQFRRYLDLRNAARILNQLAEGAFEGSREKIEETVREPSSCEVSIHGDPNSLGYNVFYLKRIKVHTGILKNFFLEREPKVWRIDSLYGDEPQVKSELVTQACKIYPYGFYVIHPDYASYTSDTGLILGEKGSALKFVEAGEREKPEYYLREESWFDHAQKTLEIFREKFLKVYSYSIKKLSESWKKSLEEMVFYIEQLLVLHDLGKLNREWQKRIGAKDENLSHSRQPPTIGLPPHATVSAYALSKLWDELPFPLGNIFKFVVAHHHSVAAREVPQYVLKENYREEVEAVLGLINCDFDVGKIVGKIIAKQEGSTIISKFPCLADFKTYRTYCLFSRILRLSDRVATAGSEETLFQFEKWFRYY
ncbi:MAG: CRISPR-associated helicase Cas3' [Candidatus Freyarchaeota archaeon]|nr:CRISPR-associated helicase Cas3' [Candidatus Jordarchaeia archaeon]MBS7268229.1 CRISPR-associated helicase Cas3' [Candidatus Jordarchaeia archaeon]MBS7279337.1 CRISPR-associated helicase Cas3' [Candidatus Jordarchaeia archaeon]